MNKYLDPSLTIGHGSPGNRSLSFPLSDGSPLRDLMASIEVTIIAATLRATGGNQRRAASALGLLPTTLKEKMKRYGIGTPSRISVPSSRTPPPPDFEPTPPTYEDIDRAR